MSVSTTAQRLIAKCIEDPLTGCLNFTGYLTGGTHQRGQLWCSESKRLKLAHRIAWELERGPIPAALSVCHHCDNPRCCNVNHLFLGTHAENMADMRAKKRGSNPPVMRGRANVNNKLSEEQARAIFADQRIGDVIAAEYSISKTTVNMIRRGEIWSWATGG